MIQVHFKPVNIEKSYSDNWGNISVQITHLSVISELELRVLLYRHFSNAQHNNRNNSDNIFLFNLLCNARFNF
jgi:hypothetical protein